MLYHFQIQNVPEWELIFKDELYVKHRKYVLFVFCCIVLYSDWLGVVGMELVLLLVLFELLIGYVVKIVAVVWDESYVSIIELFISSRGYDIFWTVYIELWKDIVVTGDEKTMDFHRDIILVLNGCGMGIYYLGYAI